MNTVGIYKITNPKGKVYIGQSVEIEKRWKRDYFKLNCFSQVKLYNSLKKYGPENHTFEVIEECKEEQLLGRETYWKKYYRVLEISSLCCRIDGIGGKLSQSTKDKISKSNLGISRNKGKPKSEETKQKMSQAVKNRIYTPERIKKMSQSMKGKNSRKIICITTNETFNSIRNAANKLLLNERSINNNLCGLSKSLKGGYKFEYV